MKFLDNDILELEAELDELKAQVRNAASPIEEKVLRLRIDVLEEALIKYRKAFACIVSMNTFENLVKTPIVCDDSDDYGTFKAENGELFIVSGKTGNVTPFEICFSPENFEYYLIAAKLQLKVVDALFPKGNFRG